MAVGWNAGLESSGGQHPRCTFEDRLRRAQCFLNGLGGRGSHCPRWVRTLRASHQYRRGVLSGDTAHVDHRERVEGVVAEMVPVAVDPFRICCQLLLVVAHVGWVLVHPQPLERRFATRARLARTTLEQRPASSEWGCCPCGAVVEAARNPDHEYVGRLDVQLQVGASVSPIQRPR